MGRRCSCPAAFRHVTVAYLSQAVPTADGWQPIALVTTPVPALPPSQDAAKEDAAEEEAAVEEAAGGPEPANATAGDRGAHARALRHPVHSRLQHHMKPKRLHRPQDSMASNKV